MAAKISVSITDEAVLEWAQRRAEREGLSLSAIVTDAMRLARQHEARVRVSNWLGSENALTKERDAAIRAELGERRTKRSTKRKPR